LLGVECLLSSRLYGDLLTVVGRDIVMNLVGDLDFPEANWECPAPILLYRMVASADPNRNT
jgi:hypothetical protein